jgi:hypothetical protein
LPQYPCNTSALAYQSTANRFRAVRFSLIDTLIYWSMLGDDYRPGLSKKVFSRR